MWVQAILNIIMSDMSKRTKTGLTLSSSKHNILTEPLKVFAYNTVFDFFLNKYIRTTFVGIPDKNIIVDIVRAHAE